MHSKDSGDWNTLPSIKDSCFRSILIHSKDSKQIIYIKTPKRFSNDKYIIIYIRDSMVYITLYT